MNATDPEYVTTFQWLIERGQPEGEAYPLWLENSGAHPATHCEWTTDARQAAMFPDREKAEAYIADWELKARAVEHGFMGEASNREKQAVSFHINYGHSKCEPEPDETCLYCDKHEDVMAYTYFGAAVCGGCWDSRWREEGGDGEHDPPFAEITRKVSGEWLTAPASNTGTSEDA